MEYELVENQSTSYDFSINHNESVHNREDVQNLNHNCCHDVRLKFCAKLNSFCRDCCKIDHQHQEYSETIRWKYGLGMAEAIFGINYCYWFQTIIHNQFCNFLFKCGCTWNWDGGWKDCNVHNTEGPRCPWCRARASISWTTDYLLTFLMTFTYIYLLSKRKKIMGHPICRLLCPILIYFVFGVIVGAFFLWDGYPYFIF